MIEIEFGKPGPGFTSRKCVRRTCHKCIFYTELKDMGFTLYFCTAQKDELQEPMHYVPAYEYEKNLEIRKEHDKPCEYYANIEEIKDHIRRLTKQEVKKNDSDNV